MNCPRCKSESTRVLHTDKTGMRIHRRRECDTCTHRFNTFETSEDVSKQLEELKKRLGPAFEMLKSEAVS